MEKSGLVVFLLTYELNTGNKHYRLSHASKPAEPLYRNRGSWLWLRASDLCWGGACFESLPRHRIS
jgi:hypothetical protein